MATAWCAPPLSAPPPRPISGPRLPSCASRDPAPNPTSGGCENAYRGTEAPGLRVADDVVGRRHLTSATNEGGRPMMATGSRVAAVVAAVVAGLMMLPAAASAAAPQKKSGKLPSSACKLLTLA